MKVLIFVTLLLSHAFTAVAQEDHGAYVCELGPSTNWGNEYNSPRGRGVGQVVYQNPSFVGSETDCMEECESHDCFTYNYNTNSPMCRCYSDEQAAIITLNPSDSKWKFCRFEDVMENFSKNPVLEYGWYRGPSSIDYGIGFCNNRINDPPAGVMTLEECAGACLTCNESGACGPTEVSGLRPQGLTFNECASFERNNGGRCFIFPSDASEREGCYWEEHSGSLDYYELVTPAVTPELTPLVLIEENPSSPGAHGDPHLVTWSGEPYDFHGICDLVLLSNPEFKENKGLDIHIRTKRIRDFSYIESSVIRIGNDTIEVTGGKNNMNKVRINGLIHEIENIGDKEEALDILGYDVRFKRMGDKAQQFVVDLGGGLDESIIFRTWNSFVSIKVQNPTAKYFGSSVGLMGSFPSGKKFARDNNTVVDDVNVFGQEWQVNGEEAKLFHEAKEPQFPQKCEIPSSRDMRRRLGGSDITMKRAEDICSHVKEYKEMCIFDVMVTNDLTMAGAY